MNIYELFRLVCVSVALIVAMMVTTPIPLAHATADGDGMIEPGEDAQQELAKKLTNPVAALISVPFDFDYDSDIGPVDDGKRWSITAKPVIPVTLNPNWNLISRTIVSYVDQEDIFPGAGSQSGLATSFRASSSRPQYRRRALSGAQGPCSFYRPPQMTCSAPKSGGLVLRR